MDSITQGLLGATIAEAFFRRRLGGRAVAWGAFCGIAPDFDMLAAFAGEWETLVHHRGITHSLLALGVASPVLGGLAYFWPGQRKGTVLSWIHLTFWALITHPLLDLCTSYGTQLFLPVTNARYAIDAVPIVDLAYSLPLLFAVIYSLRGRLRKRTAIFAVAMLVLTTAYLGFGYVQSQRAIARARNELRESSFSAAQVRAYPTLLNVFVFRVVARDRHGAFRVATVSLSAPRPLRWYDAPSPGNDPLVRRARASPRGRTFAWFAMGMVHYEVDDRLVRMSDMRYGSVRDPSIAMWGADARFDRDGRLLDVVRWQRRGEVGIGAELSALWGHLVGAR